MGSLSCCSETSFSCLAGKISSPVSNPAGAMKDYQLGAEISGGLGVWDACRSVVWGLSCCESCVIKVPTTGNNLPLKGVEYGQCWNCLTEEMLSCAPEVVNSQLL